MLWGYFSACFFVFFISNYLPTNSCSYRTQSKSNHYLEIKESFSEYSLVSYFKDGWVLIWLSMEGRQVLSLSTDCLPERIIYFLEVSKAVPKSVTGGLERARRKKSGFQYTHMYTFSRLPEDCCSIQQHETQCRSYVENLCILQSIEINVIYIYIRPWEERIFIFLGERLLR